MFLDTLSHPERWDLNTEHKLQDHIALRPEERIDDLLINIAKSKIEQEGKLLDHWSPKMVGTNSEATLYLIGARGTVKAVNFLASLISNPHSVIRAAIPRALGKKTLCDPTNEKALLGVVSLVKDSNPNVQVEAAGTLSDESLGGKFVIISEDFARALVSAYNTTEDGIMMQNGRPLKSIFAYDIKAYIEALKNERMQDPSKGSAIEPVMRILEHDSVIQKDGEKEKK